MDYPDTLDWLFTRFPAYQSQGKSAFKKGLTHIRLLLNHLKNPQKTFHSIHVAGTNGKGSVSHILAAALQAQGYRVGLYTSPHLLDFTERIRLNGQVINRDEVVEFTLKNKAFLESHSFSFFEVTTAMAFYFFSKEQMSYAVVETGLGGRLDSTNAIYPILSVITNVSLDHTDILGDTLSKIAAEKAGIIKPHTPVVIGEEQGETSGVFEKRAAAVQAPLYHAENFNPTGFKTDLKGAYQRKNIRTAHAALQVLKTYGVPVSDGAVKDGLGNVVKNTGLRGRWEKLGDNPLRIADIAHNEAGLREVVSELSRVKRNRLHAVLGFVKGRDIECLIRLFPGDALYYFSKPQIFRGLSTASIKPVVGRLGLRARYFDSVSIALRAAARMADPADVIYIGGSTFVVAEILDKLR